MNCTKKIILSAFIATLFCVGAFCQISIVNEGIMLFDVAEKYRLGEGVQQDYNKAVEFYKRAMELEEPMSFRVMGHLYLTGTGVQKDSKKAWNCYYEAKRHGVFPEQDYSEPYAKKELAAKISASNQHLKKSEDEWMMLAADARENPSEYSEIFTCQYYMTPARLGNAAAQYWVGKYYCECVNPNQKEEYEEAIIRARKWLSLSASQGNEQAKKLLSTLPEVSTEKNQISTDEARGLYSLLENIKEQKSLFAEEISARNLFTLLNDRFSTSSVSVDEEKNEIKFSNIAKLCVDSERQLLFMFSYLTPKKILPQDECIKIANEWNQKKIFSIVCWDDDSFRIEYYMTYQGGIHADNLNDSLAWYFDLLYGFFDYLDKYADEH